MRQFILVIHKNIFQKYHWHIRAYIDAWQVKIINKCHSYLLHISYKIFIFMCNEGIRICIKILHNSVLCGEIFRCIRLKILLAISFFFSHVVFSFIHNAHIRHTLENYVHTYVVKVIETLTSSMQLRQQPHPSLAKLF